MRLSQLFTHTLRENPKDEMTVNAKLLIRAGFVFKNLAGVWSLLPLGVRVMKKIEQIIREEMAAIGGQELHLNILQDRKLWEKTGRWDEASDIMYRFNPGKLGLPHSEPDLSPSSDGSGPARSTDLSAQGGTMPDQSPPASSVGQSLAPSTDYQLGLGFTHEEVVAQIATQYIHSYRDLPKYVYQIQTKFRNEPRAQAGLLRGREFEMKDLYSLTATKEQLDEFYEQVAKAYLKIFKRLGLEAIRTEASGGLFSKRSHEFQVISDAGEDTIYVCDKCDFAINKEIAHENPKSKIPASLAGGQNPNKFQMSNVKCQKCGDGLIEHRSIEVGNIFKLGTRFSEPLGLYFTDQDGSRKPVVMGSYGIGIGRAMGTVVEAHHDKRGVIWPETIAPYRVHLIQIPNSKSQSPNKSQTPNPKQEAEKLYNRLHDQGIEVLYDDREDVSAGEKLADADLIGCPIRVVVSQKTVARQSFELKRRNEAASTLIGLLNLISKIQNPNF